MTNSFTTINLCDFYYSLILKCPSLKINLYNYPNNTIICFLKLVFFRIIIYIFTSVLTCRNFLQTALYILKGILKELNIKGTERNLKEPP